MTSQVLPGRVESGRSRLRGIQWAVGITLSAWFVLVVSLGAAGAFNGPPGKPPLPIGIGISAPVLLFFAGMWLSHSFREFVLSIDLRLIAAVQAWRFAGLGLLFLYAHDVLPAVFALPAGLGDMAVGVTAPWMMLALARRADFAASAAFTRWNWLGILDLVVAGSIGALNSMLATGAAGEISATPMALLPQLLIPAFLVPLFLMLHVAALLQGRQLGRNHAALAPGDRVR